MSNITLVQDLLKRRVPQFIGVYVVASWTILQIIDWLVNRYILSPYLVDLSLGVIIALIPTILIIAYFHGKPGKDKWTNVEKIGIPINLVSAVIILAIVFYPKDLGAATKTIIVENEEGQRMKRIVPKSDFIRSVALFSLKNNIEDKEYEWISQGIWKGVGCDLGQELFIHSADDQVVSMLQDKGFSTTGNPPIALKRSISKDLHLEYFSDGSVELNDKNEFVVTSNLYTTDDGKLQVSHTFVNTDIFTIIDDFSLQLRYDLGIPTGHIESSVDLPANEMLTDSLDAFKNFSIGIGLIFGGDFEGGIPYLEKAIEIDETFAMAYLPLQGSYVMTNRGDQRKDAIERCMKYMYKLPERFHYLPNLIYFSVTQDIDKMMQTLDIHLNLFPYDMQARDILTQVFLSQGKYQKIIEEYETILTIDPTRYNYLLKMGQIYDRFIDNQDKAMEYYSQYLDYFPNDYKVHAQLARLYSNLGEKDKAKESWNKVLLLEPGNIKASIKIVAYDYEGLEQIENTYKILNDCKEPGDSLMVYYYIDEELTEHGMFEEALNVWKKYDKIRARIQPFAQYSIENVFVPGKYAEIGKVEEAFKLMDEYEKIYQPPFDFQILIGKLILYGTLEDAVNTEKYLNEVIQKAGEIGGEIILDVVIADNAIDARLEILKKDYDKAIELINANKNKDWDKMQALLSKSYRLKGDLETSKEIIEKMCDDEDYCSKDAQYEAALVYYDLGEHDKAREYLNSCLDHYQHADATYKPVAEARETLSKWDASGN